jgi:hypothetical protein
MCFYQFLKQNYYSSKNVLVKKERNKKKKYVENYLNNKFDNLVNNKVH